MINGKNIYLRMPELTDLEELYELVNTEENRDFLRFYRPLSKIEEENWIKSCSEKAKKGDNYNFVIIEKETNKVVGTTSILNINIIPGTGVLGITLNSKYQNKGYGPETLKLLMKWGFETLNLNLIAIEASGNNERGLHVYKDKLKFKHEATLRSRMYKNGKYYDTHIFSMTKEEYNEIYGEKE